jgi:hypothetical protein
MVLAKSWSPAQSSDYRAILEAISWVVVFLAGALLTTDYDVLNRFGSSRLYGWIQNQEDVVKSVERYYHAKRYVESDSGTSRIPVTYWNKGRFRATIEDEDVREGLHYWVKVDVPSKDPSDGVRTPLYVCTVSLDRLRETNESGTYEGFFSVVEMKTSRDAVDEHEREQYKEVLPKIWRGEQDVDPYLTIRVADELEELELEEWEALYEGLETVGDQVLD